VTLTNVITDTRKAVTDDPAAAQALFSTHSTLTGVTEVAVRTASHAFTVDEPPALGGDGSAPNPVEYALASLGSCQAITYRFWAEHLGISFDQLTVMVEGDLDIRGFSLERLLASPRLALNKKLLMLPGAEPQNYTEQVDDVLALIGGSYRTPDGVEAHVIPGENAGVQIWILGSSGGESAEVAGERGLRFAANYHVSPATVLEAVEGYRSAFRPSGELSEPYVSVSADVVVAGDEPTARELAAGYGPWVLSIRTGAGAIAFPTPEQARGHRWTDEDRTLVADRIDTQFVGSPKQVADRLEQLRDATGADELIVTTITHDHADRVRSYQLLADEWQRR
jgi:hypothetical protein